MTIIKCAPVLVCTSGGVGVVVTRAGGASGLSSPPPPPPAPARPGQPPCRSRRGVVVAQPCSCQHTHHSEAAADHGDRDIVTRRSMATTAILAALLAAPFPALAAGEKLHLSSPDIVTFKWLHYSTCHPRVVLPFVPLNAGLSVFTFMLEMDQTSATIKL